MCLRILIQVIIIWFSFILCTAHYQAGAAINTACGPRGESRTPLHIAAEHGHVVNAQTLVDAGADLLAKDGLGEQTTMK